MGLNGSDAFCSRAEKNALRYGWHKRRNASPSPPRPSFAFGPARIRATLPPFRSPASSPRGPPFPTVRLRPRPPPPCPRRSPPSSLPRGPGPTLPGRSVPSVLPPGSLRPLLPPTHRAPVLASGCAASPPRLPVPVVTAVLSAGLGPPHSLPRQKTPPRPRLPTRRGLGDAVPLRDCFTVLVLECGPRRPPTRCAGGLAQAPHPGRAAAAARFPAPLPLPLY